MSEPNPNAIPLLDLDAQNRPLLPALEAAFRRVATHGKFILGPEVDTFEKDIASFIGVKHAVGVSSGTDALVVSLMALDVRTGDEVITSPYSFFATAGSIARLGAKPVFVDIEPDTYNIDPVKIARAITPKTKAIVVVHLYGQTCNMQAVMEIARARGIPVVEDAAQAIGAVGNAGAAGTAGALGCFSFFPSKNLGALGDAGLVTTNDDALAERTRVLRAHGAKPKYFHKEIGGNFRIDALQAALLGVKLPHLTKWAEMRRANARRYDEGLRGVDTLVTPKRVFDGHIYNQYVVRTPRREALRKHLTSVGIGTEIYYPRPLHLQECFAALGYTAGSLPEAERASEETLAIPIYAELTDAQKSRVIAEVIAGVRQTSG